MSESTSETPVLDLLESMTADSLEASGRDIETVNALAVAIEVAEEQDMGDA